MAIPQLTIYLTPKGKVKAEAPGRNGARSVLDLGDLASILPQEILMELRWQAVAIARDDADAVRNATATRIEREERQEREAARKQEIAERQSTARAHALYEAVDQKHGRPLADRVIPEAARRPHIGRRIIVGANGARSINIEQSLASLKATKRMIVKRQANDLFAALETIDAE